MLYGLWYEGLSISLRNSYQAAAVSSPGGGNAMCSQRLAALLSVFFAPQMPIVVAYAAVISRHWATSMKPTLNGLQRCPTQNCFS